MTTLSRRAAIKQESAAAAGALRRIPLSCPDINKGDIHAVVGVLRSQKLSLGPKLPEFEEALARFVGTKQAVAISSGTAGLYLCLIAGGIGPGDEVITTPFSFIASTNVILHVGAKPVFVDIDPITLNMDVAQVAARVTKRTRALLPVHVFGRPCEMDPLLRLAREHDLFVLEDACEAIGARYHGKPVGTLGNAGVFAFYPNKQMTTGEGGVIVTNDGSIAAMCRSLRNQGRGTNGGWLMHERLGYNFRMTDIQAVLGLSQVHRLPELLSARAKVASWYQRALQNCEEVILPAPTPNGVTLSWFVYVILLKPGFTGQDRNEILGRLREGGIDSSNYFPPIHLQPFIRDRFGYKAGDFAITEDVASRTVALPFHGRLLRREVEYVASALKTAVRRMK